MKNIDVKTMNDDTNDKGYVDISQIVKPVLMFSIVATLVAFMIVTSRICTDELMKMEAEDTITQGIVTQHEYVNGYSNILRGYTPPRYRLHVEGTYEYNGEVFTGNTYFDVSEEAYNYFEDGDYFNSATFLKEIAQLKQDSSDTITES